MSEVVINLTWNIKHFSPIQNKNETRIVKQNIWQRDVQLTASTYFLYNLLLIDSIIAASMQLSILLHTNGNCAVDARNWWDTYTNTGTKRCYNSTDKNNVKHLMWWQFGVTEISTRCGSVLSCAGWSQCNLFRQAVSSQSCVLHNRITLHRHVLFQEHRVSQSVFRFCVQCFNSLNRMGHAYVTE